MDSQAFPIQKHQYTLQGFIQPAEYHPGLTKLEYFAVAALPKESDQKDELARGWNLYREQAIAALKAKVR